jgi:hypothetical protein
MSAVLNLLLLLLVEKKKMDIFAESPSPPRDNKGKLTESEAATVMAAKWKMQIGSVPSRWGALWY